VASPERWQKQVTIETSNLSGRLHSNRKAPVSCIDSRARILALLFLSLPVAITTDFATATAGLALATILVTASGISFRTIIHQMARANFFIMLIWLVTPFTTEGTTIFQYGLLKISSEGLLAASLVTLKSNAVIMLFIALAATIPVPEIGWALQKLCVPGKLCLLLVFAYRHIFIIGQEYNRLARAAKVRCFSPGTNLHTYRTYAYLVAMTLVRSWNRAEKIGNAMKLRGFDRRFIILGKNRFRIKDTVFLIASLAAATICIYIGNII
jgi:cobalt/nickel transport system permease protein